jgi:hypothetical protein
MTAASMITGGGGSDGAADAWEDVNLQMKTTAGTESTMI